MRLHRLQDRQNAFRCSVRRFGAAKTGFGARAWVGGLHRTESGAVFTAFQNALSSLGRRTYTNLWAPGWVQGSQDEILQGLEEKSQEPITMGSWLRSWLSSRRFSRRFETRSAVSGGLPARKPVLECRGRRAEARRARGRGRRYVGRRVVLRRIRQRSVHSPTSLRSSQNEAAGEGSPTGRSPTGGQSPPAQYRLWRIAFMP